jgi:hypothetical protein
MNTFRKFMEMKEDDEEKSFFNQLGLKYGHEGLQTKMKSFDIKSIKDIQDRLENWTKFNNIKDTEKKEKIIRMLYKPTKSLNDIYILTMDKEFRS